MTTGISTSTNQQISPLLKSIIGTKNQANTPQATQQNATDTFIKKDKKKTSDEVKVATITTIGRLASTILLLTCLPKAVKSILPKIDAKEPISLWQSLDNAISIKDMSLPKNLKKLLDDTIDYINNSADFNEKGVTASKRILLYGPPGTGKTTFAKAIAKEIDANFASIDVTRLNSYLAGKTEQNIRDAVEEICKKAQENPQAKFLVFIDEIDSIMMVDKGNSAKYSNDVLNEVKTCLTERLGKYNNVITIGATNLNIDPQKAITAGGKQLDSAMLSRFDQQIEVGLPSKEQIKDFFVRYYKNKTRVEEELQDKNSKKLDIICEFLSDKKHNVSFRTLQGIFNDAGLNRNKNIKTSISDILAAIEKRKEELNVNIGELEKLQEQLKLNIPQN